MALDTLQARNRYLALYDRYGALLTDHQRQVLDLHLGNDWSLAEIAANQGTSRAAEYLFAISSVLTPFALGTAVGAIATGSSVSPMR